MSVSVELSEDFNSPQGSYANYDAYDQTLREALQARSHVDIRVFENADVTTPQTVIGLSALLMSFLSTQTMTQLQSSVAIRKGEAWTVGTVAKDAARKNLRVLSLTLSAGTTTTASVIPKSVGAGVETIDLITGFDNNDFISMALPSFPLAQVTQASSFVDFTSNTTGNFTTGPTASVALSASTVSLISGNSEFRVLRSAFNQNSIDLSKITGVRLRIVGTGAATMRVMGLRLLGKGWTHGPLDMDTIYGQLRMTVPPNGNAAGSPPLAQPVVFRSDIPSGENDPRPIDTDVGVVFNTGSIVGSNSFSVYFRELTEDFMTMLDVDGISMGNFDGHPMPDIGDARYNSRTQADLDPFAQSVLDEETQFSLERTSDSTSSLYIAFTVLWSNVTQTVSILNSEGNGFTATISGLLANSTYIAYCSLEENTAQLTIYALDAGGNVTTLIYDSTKKLDDFNYKRRKGRFGWFASFADGDAWIDSIRTRGITFAEYRSLPYESITPVVGVELFATNTPNVSLFTIMGAGPYNNTTTVVGRDSAVSTTGESYRLQSFGTQPMQGFQSNLFSLSDFANAHIKFDILYPSTALAESNVTAFLLERNNGRTIPLLIPNIVADQWQTIDIDLPVGPTSRAGDYRMVLIQSSGVASVWWIDNIQIYERSVIWDARGVVDDPWFFNSARWTPFYDNYSRENGGVLFEKRGNQLQVRGRARRQTSRIDRIQFKPKYAELGRLVF